MRAQAELQHGRTAAAIPILEDYRKLHPGVAEVYNLLGYAYATQGNNDQAHSMFQEFARLAPNRPEAYNNLGACDLRRGDAASAEKDFRRALALKPDDPNALYNLGALLNARHDYGNARPLLLKARQHDTSAGVVFELAVAQAGTGDRKSALRTLSSQPLPSGPEGLAWLRLLGTLNLDEGRLPEAIKALQQALVLDPTDQMTLYSLGLAELKSGHIDDATQMLEKSMSSLPPAERCLKTGAFLAQSGADAQAATEFQRAIQQDPQMYDAYFNLAVVEQRRNNINSAADVASHALAVKQTAEAYNLLGEIREQQGQYREALESLQQATRLDPMNEAFVFDLGLELILHQNDEVAAQVFTAAAQRFPNSARIALGLGATQYMTEKLDDSIKTFIKAVDLDPQYEPAYTFLGTAYLSSQNASADAPACLARVARNHMDSFTAQFYYGAALVKQMDRSGKRDEIGPAAAALRRASALRPDDGPTYYYLGEIKRLQDQTEEAVALYEKAIALDPTLTDALYKLGRAYAKLGRQEDSLRILAKHREVLSRETEALDKRMDQVKTFILAVRNVKQ
jgi:tetratricopeptide (TPR) repeat protein